MPHAPGVSRCNHDSSGPVGDSYAVAASFVLDGSGTAQVLRNQVAEQILGRKLPQTRDGYLKLAAE